ncbi:MAG: glycosyltransferase family 9 protein, partial [Blastocatellia bacterium]
WQLALLVAFSRSKWRIGHVTSPGWSRRFSRYSFVFNVPVRMKEDEHEVDRYFDLLEPLGVSRVRLSSVAQFIHLSDDDERYAARFFETAGITGHDTVLGIQPGTSSNMRWKQWPIDRFRALIEKLVAAHPQVRIIMFGSAHEASISADLTRGLESNVTLAVGKTSVKQVAAMIKRCDAMLCNDSGLMHVAVAVGTPVIAIYGPTDIRRTRPLGREHVVIRHEMECSPCFRLEGEDRIHECPHHNCLVTITPDEILSAIVHRLTGGAECKAVEGSDVVGNRVERARF